MAMLGVACAGPQVAVPPGSTPYVVFVTPSTEPALVQASPTPLDIPTTAYRIQAGETLTEIAARYDLTVDELAALNGIENPNTIQVGQEIRVPRR